MSTHDDFDINISRNEEPELSEKEYSDILGLEGMAGGGEAALEEAEEEKEEDTLAYVFAEHHSQKKSAYRRYTHEDESEERSEDEITIPEHREAERKREDLSTNVSLDDNVQLDGDEDITNISTESTQSNLSHTDFNETAYIKPLDTTINKDEQVNHSELRISEDIVQETMQITAVENRQNESVKQMNYP